MTRWLRLPAALFALALLLAACGDDSGDDGSSGGGSAGSDTPSNDYGGGGSDTGGDCSTDVCMQDIAFAPDSVTVSAGDTVEWTNLDSTTHTVTADDDAFDSGDLGDGDTFEFTFDEAGEYTYHCSIHSSMTGTVVVQ